MTQYLQENYLTKKMENNYLHQQILDRYQTNNLFLHYQLKELQNINVNNEFVCSLLKAFDNSNTFPKEELNKFSLAIILDYIQRTHAYYITKKLPEIAQSISLLLLDEDSHHHVLLHRLNTFFKQFYSDIILHIHQEENRLLPYINYLRNVIENGFNSKIYFNNKHVFSLQLFINNHKDNTETELQFMLNLIENYKPHFTNQTPYRILKLQLQTFEKDLKVHALIEDDILIPRALQLEKQLAKKLSDLIKVN